MPALGAILSTEKIPVVVSTTSSIDLKTVAATTLYTVPTGKRFLYISAIIHLINGNTISVAPTVSIGQNATTYNDIVTNTSLATLITTDQQWSFTGSETNSPFVSVPQSTAIKLNVSVGATATTMTATVYLIGFLI